MRVMTDWLTVYHRTVYMLMSTIPYRTSTGPHTVWFTPVQYLTVLLPGSPGSPLAPPAGRCPAAAPRARPAGGSARPGRSRAVPAGTVWYGRYARACCGRLRAHLRPAEVPQPCGLWSANKLVSYSEEAAVQTLKSDQEAALLPAQNCCFDSWKAAVAAAGRQQPRRTRTSTNAVSDGTY